VVLFLGGLQLLTLGIMGEYLGRAYMEVKQRPLYLITERHGFTPADQDAPSYSLGTEDAAPARLARDA